MPLPTNDPVAFKGVPSLGGNKKMALTMTFTQKQVEAMFQRHDALRAQGSSQCPLEIDFEDNKIYIGDIATPFTRVKEDGTREICQRSPTVSRPLAGITLAGNVIGKLNIQRDYDQDISDNIRKLTEAELSKRKEHHIVRLDSPPVMSNGKKSKPGSGTSSLAKKAIANSIVSSQAASRRASAAVASRPATPKTTPQTSRPTPPSSSVRPTPSGSSGRPSTSTSSTTQPVASSSTPAELDLTSLRSHMIHYLAFGPKNTQDVLLKMAEHSPGVDNTGEIEETLTTVAEEVPRPKNAPPGPVLWQLRNIAWEELRPYQYGSLSDDDRKKLARKGRITLASIVDLSDPLWDHLRSDVDLSVIPTSTKGKEKIATSQHLVKTSNFKGGMFPKEKKSTTKGGGVTSGGVTKTKATATKPKQKKVQDDEVEAKTRKVIATLDDAKVKGKKAASASTSASGSASNRSRLKEEEEEEAIPLSTKSRQSLASKNDDALPVSKARRAQDEKPSLKHKLPDVDADGDSEMEEGELSTKPVLKKRKIDAPKVKPKQSEKAGALPFKSGKEKEKISPKDEGASSKLAKEAPRISAIGSSSKVAGPSSNKARLEKERERQEREALEKERLKDREREKRRASEKRSRRRPTPSFSSDEDKEETKLAPPRTTKSKHATQLPAKSTAPASKPARAPSPILPTDKEGLRLHYVSRYAHYMALRLKLYEQVAKIEKALADSGSTDEDVEMMDTEQLMQLRGEHERARDELERIQRAHAIAF